MKKLVLFAAVVASVAFVSCAKDAACEAADSAVVADSAAVVAE